MPTETEIMIDLPQLFIGGEWVDPAAGETIEVISPATEEVVGRVGAAGPADMDAAVAAARGTFDSGVWAEADPAERAAVLRRAADALEARAPELVDLLTAELGCPRAYAAAAHIPNPIRNLRYYAELAEGKQWEEPRSDANGTTLVRSAPVGVVAAITPWNGPLSNPTLKIAPALAAGCSVVSKPAPDAPLSTIALAEELDAAGLPAGVFNLVPGGREAGEHLVSHAAVDKVAFTGSTAAGKRVAAICAERVARVTLELGGKSAAIVLEDVDLDDLARRLPPMLLAVNGQACIAQSRVLAPRSRLAEITEALTATMAGAVLGDPFDPATTVGPLISAVQRERVEGFLASARDDGAVATTGGGRPADRDRGFYVEPTVLAGVAPEMRVAQEEIFGPVMSIIAYDTPAEAVAIANDSVYGLSGSIWSADRERALGIARRIRTGMVHINGAPLTFGTPFGGFKQSGIGREMGPEGLRTYTELQSIAIGKED
jgi:betaine-aldehyde dehydrogenase